MAKTFMVTYTYAPDMLERRTPYRPDHLAHLNKAVEAGRIVIAGAFADPVDGAVLLVEGETAGDIISWVGSDPYAQAGLIRGVAVRELTVAVRRP